MQASALDHSTIKPTVFGELPNLPESLLAGGLSTVSSIAKDERQRSRIPAAHRAKMDLKTFDTKQEIKPAVRLNHQLFDDVLYG